MIQNEREPSGAKPLSMTSWLDVLRAVLPPNGVLVVGAGSGDGAWVRWLQTRHVSSEGVRVHLLEGDERQYHHLQNRLPRDASWKLHPDILVGSRGSATFYCASNPAESGLLVPEILQPLWPHLGTEQSKVIEHTITLDALQQEAEGRLNWLMLDCLPAGILLQGGGQLLATLDVALLRVVTASAGRDLLGEPLADQEAVEELLRTAGLRCIHSEAERHPALAHVLYVRDADQRAQELVGRLHSMHVAHEAWSHERAALTKSALAATEAAEHARCALTLAETQARQSQERARTLATQVRTLQQTQERFANEAEQLKQAGAREKAELRQAHSVARQAVEQATAYAQGLEQRLQEAQALLEQVQVELKQVRESTRDLQAVHEREASVRDREFLELESRNDKQRELLKLQSLQLRAYISSDDSEHPSTSIRRLERYRAKRKLFIDCGGHDGCSTIKYLTSHPEFDAVTFEPNPTFWKYYEKIPALLVKAVVGPKAGMAKLTVDVIDGDGSSVVVKKRVDNTGERENIELPTIDVPSINLSHFVRDASKFYESLVLKLDIEGSEYGVLNSMLADGTLPLIDRLLCEFHWKKIGMAAEEHESLLKRVQAIVPVEHWDALEFSIHGRNSETLARIRGVLVSGLRNTREEVGLC